MSNCDPHTGAIRSRAPAEGKVSRGFRVAGWEVITYAAPDTTVSVQEREFQMFQSTTKFPLPDSHGDSHLAGLPIFRGAVVPLFPTWHGALRNLLLFGAGFPAAEIAWATSRVAYSQSRSGCRGDKLC